MSKSVKSIVTLVAICAVVTVVLALTNAITAATGMAIITRRPRMIPPMVFKTFLSVSRLTAIFF